MTCSDVASGEDLAAALAAQSHAWITAVGEIDDVELVLAGSDGRVERQLPGSWTLASLAGPGAGPFWVVLSRSADTGIQLVAGQLRRATSRGVHVFGSGEIVQVTSREPELQAAPLSNPPVDTERRAPSWAAQAKAAVPPRAAASEDDDLWPDVGDVVEHFAFGRCDVLMASDDRLKIRDQAGARRVREIRAEMLRVRAPVVKDGKRLFKLERKN